MISYMEELRSLPTKIFIIRENIRENIEKHTVEAAEQEHLQYIVISLYCIIPYAGMYF